MSIFTELSSGMKWLIGTATTILGFFAVAIPVWQYYHPEQTPKEPDSFIKEKAIITGELTRIGYEIIALRDSLDIVLSNLEESEQLRRTVEVKIGLLESLLKSKTDDHTLITIRRFIIENNYDEFLPEILAKPNDTSIIKMAEWHFQIASVNNLRLNYELASDNYLKAIELQPNNLKYVKSAIVVLDSAKRYEDASNILKNAITVVRGLSENTLFEAGLHESLANIWYNLKDYDKAEKSYYDAREIYEKEDKNKFKVSNCYSGIATLYAAKGEYQIAIEQLGQAIEIDTSYPDMLKRNTATDFEQLARIEVLQGHDAEAIGHYNKALEIWNSMPGNDIQIASLYNNMANSYRHVREIASAKECYKKALGMFEKLDGPKCARAITIRKNLAQLSDIKVNI